VTLKKQAILDGNPELAIQAITPHNDLALMSNDLMSTPPERASWKMGLRIPLQNAPPEMVVTYVALQRLMAIPNIIP
jgi:hypothetical protein